MSTQSISSYIDQVRILDRRVRASRARHINSTTLKLEVRERVKNYFEGPRVTFHHHGLDVSGIDTQMQMLLSYANARTRTSAYQRLIAAIIRSLNTLEAQLVVAASDRIVQSTQSVGSFAPQAQDKKIIDTLTKIIPAAALSYQQVLIDLGDRTKVSFRGTAAELREILREVLDYLAPDKEVMENPGFKLEKDKSLPTMKQKVRFILKTRKKSQSAIEVPESATNIVDESVATLARATYNRGSVSTHVATEREEVVNVKRYLDSVLCELLEIY